MNLEVVQQNQSQLQQEVQGVMQSLQSLAVKLKNAADAGDSHAREWLLDLKEIALNIQSEQQHLNNFVWSIVQAAQNEQMQGGYGAPNNNGAWQGAQQPSNAGWQGAQQQPAGGGGFLGNFLNSGFGRALEMGVGFGIGDSIINDIF